MGIIKRIGRLGLATSLAIAISGCGNSSLPQAQAWSGSTTVGAAVHPLRVDVAVDGATWSGTYTIGSTPPFTGDVAAELIDGVLTGRLVATSSCAFDLSGTVADDALEATFTPGVCPGADSGIWNATLTPSGYVE